ncbi:MAG TPA: DUF4357 domain-containing protein [Mesorhizobium sp.]
MKLKVELGLDLAVSAELLSNERVRIYKGSEALRNRQKTTGQPMVDRARLLRDDLIKAGVLVALVRDPDRLVFTQDIDFDTPTAAADIVFGANKSGREFWKSSIDGKSLVELFGPAR